MDDPWYACCPRFAFDPQIMPLHHDHWQPTQGLA
jgi:hypothetical protein